MKVLQTANLGYSQRGISGSIQYAVYDTLGGESVSLTNSNVYEVGNNTGIYGVELNLSTQFSGSILWKVENTNIYASEEIKIDQKMARYIHTGRWIVDENNNQMIFYEDDNVTEVARYDLKDKNGNPTVESIFERTKA
jgi:hypothetical protein